MIDPDRTASLMTPSKLAQAGRAKAAVSPNAWLDQMAADAGHAQLQRLAELAEVLRTHARARHAIEIADLLKPMAACVAELDFSLLEPRGWWARTTGKSRTAGAEFERQVEAVAEAARPLAAQLQTRQQRSGPEQAATERALVELEVEYQALDKLIDQAGRWLHDMQAQLKPRLAQAADDAARSQVRADAARCEILAARLKRLRAVSALAQQVHEQARSGAEARTVFAQVLQQRLAPEIKSWQSRLVPLAAAAAEGRSPVPGVPAADEAQQALRRRLDETIAAAAAAGSQETSLADAVAALLLQIEAAAG